MIADAALLVRILLFAGRGDYIGFDEGWYLLLADSLANGKGYRLSGLQHTTFSPLFPALVAMVHAAGVSLITAGRVVSCVASALLVLPAWALFRQLADRRTALLGTAVAMALPSLMAFVPFWSGRELFVGGSEPLFHFLLYGALAVLVRPSPGRAVAASIALGLGFLARPEALAIAGLPGGGPGGPVPGAGPRLGTAAAYGAAFVLVVSPWLVHLHGVTGEWTLSRRTAPVGQAVSAAASGQGVASSEAGVTEALLWGGSEMGHIRAQFSLDASATRLRTGYWGVHPEEAPPAVDPWEPLPPPESVQPTNPEMQVDPPGNAELYVRTLGIIVPLGLWLWALVGLVWLPGRTRGWRDLQFLAPPRAFQPGYRGPGARRSAQPPLPGSARCALCRGRYVAGGRLGRSLSRRGSPGSHPGALRCGAHGRSAGPDRPAGEPRPDGRLSATHRRA